MWCVMKAPLILGFPVGVPGYPKCLDCDSPRQVLDIVLNTEMIAINQDPVGVPVNQTATLACAKTNIAVYAGPVHGGHVLMLLNTQSPPGPWAPGPFPAMDCPAASVDLSAVLGVAKGVSLHCRRIDDGSNSSCGTLVAGVQNLTVPVLSHEGVVVRFTAATAAATATATSPIAHGASPAFQAARSKPAATATFTFPRPATRRPTLVSAGGPAPWPMRGFNAAHTGKSPHRGPSVCALKWVFGNTTQNSGQSYESVPAVSGSGLVLAVLNYRDGGFLYALDVETGVQRWNASMNGSAWASPLVIKTATASELVVLGSEDGNAYAFHTDDGAVAWRFKTRGPVFSSAVTADPESGTSTPRRTPRALWHPHSNTRALWHSGTRPAWAGLFEGLALRSRGSACACNSRSWARARVFGCARTHVGAGHDTVYVGSWDGSLYGLDPSTGVLRGSVAMGTQIRTHPALLTVAAGHERLYLSVGIALVCVDSTRGKMAVSWAVNTTGFAYASPSLGNGAAYFPSSGDHSVRALDLATGHVLWEATPTSNGDLTNAQQSAQGVLGGDATFYTLGADHSNCNGIVQALATTNGTDRWAQPGGPSPPGSTGTCDFPAALCADSAGLLWVLGRSASNRQQQVLKGMDTRTGNYSVACNAVWAGQQGGGQVVIARDGLAIVSPLNGGGIIAIGQ